MDAALHVLPVIVPAKHVHISTGFGRQGFGRPHNIARLRLHGQRRAFGCGQAGSSGQAFVLFGHGERQIERGINFREKLAERLRGATARRFETDVTGAQA